MSSLRDSMPGVAAIVDDLRAAFGVEEINGQIRLGMNGGGTFMASENGKTVGSIAPLLGQVVSGCDMVLARPAAESARVVEAGRVVAASKASRGRR